MRDSPLTRRTSETGGAEPANVCPDAASLEIPTFHLESGSRKLTLRFSAGALEALKLEIGAGFVSIPRRGAEVGGVLQGEAVEEGSAWRITIDAIVPVPIQYQYGPSFRLSDADKQQFQTTVESGKTAHPIGWYRSNTRPGHDPDDADRQVGDTFFHAPSTVFLLCQPSGDGRIGANCIITAPDQTEIAFPFELGRFSRLDLLLEASEPSAPPVAHLCRRPSLSISADEERVSAPTRAWPSVYLNEEDASAPQFFVKHTPRRRTVIIAAALIAAAAVALFARRFETRVSASPALPVAESSPAPVAPAVSAPVGLRAEYQGNALLISWDLAAARIAAARSAVFTITDGARTRLINLSPRELRNGSILYRPGGDDISVEMEVTSDAGATASQSLRIVGASTPGALRAIPRVGRSAPVASDGSFQPPSAAAPAQRSIVSVDAPDLVEPLPSPELRLPVTNALAPAPAASQR